MKRQTEESGGRGEWGEMSTQGRSKAQPCAQTEQRSGERKDEEQRQKTTCMAVTRTHACSHSARAHAAVRIFTQWP